MVPEVIKRLWDEDSAARRPLKVVRSGRTTVAIEVKSGQAKPALPGLEAFGKEFRDALTSY